MKTEKMVVKTTDKYNEIKTRFNAEKGNDTDGIILDGIECLKERVIAMFHGWEQVDTFLECLADNEDLNIVEFDNGWFGCYYELNNKARKELERMGA